MKIKIMCLLLAVALFGCCDREMNYEYHRKEACQRAWDLCVMGNKDSCEGYDQRCLKEVKGCY